MRTIASARAGTAFLATPPVSSMIAPGAVDSVSDLGVDAALLPAADGKLGIGCEQKCRRFVTR